MAAYLRHLINDMVPQKALAPDYYAMMQQLYRISNSLNQIPQKAHTLNVINVQRYHDLSKKIKTAEQRITEIKILQQHIVNYSKTRNVYIGYRKAGHSKKYLAEHEADILLHKAAKKYFDDQGLEKLPTFKSLQSEYAELIARKKSMYSDYKKAQEKMRELQTAKANIDRILNMEIPERDYEIPARSN